MDSRDFAARLRREHLNCTDLHTANLTLPGVRENIKDWARRPGMDLGLSGRVAIVAAASKGLGRAVADELAREGAEIAICARTAADLEKAAQKIQAMGGREVFWQPLD